MVTLEEFKRRAQKLDKFVKEESLKLLKKRGKQITDLVKDQHHKGLNADGKVMQDGYSGGYTKRRKKKGLQTKFVDQHFSGRYHNKMKPVENVAEDGLDIKSGVDYERYLRGNFPNSVGLTPKNAEKEAVRLANKLAPEIKQFLVG
jgi:hypothetical protein